VQSVEKQQEQQQLRQKLIDSSEAAVVEISEHHGKHESQRI
jgi:hypothetical protein